MPTSMRLPEGQIWIRWICECCKKTALFTIPKNGAGSGTWPFEISLGMHRELSRGCKMKDVTLRGGHDGVLEVVMERGKSSARSA